MTEQERHEKIWRVMHTIAHPWICRKFNLTHDELRLDGPCLLISNHVCAWDPLLVAMSLKHKQVYYVASEHLFRKGLVSKALNYLVAPIPRRKASSGFETVKICLRRLKEGGSVGLFAEGEQSWDGRTAPIFSATGKLARNSGASLVTYRLEGAYLSLPRWGKGGVRRGAVHGHVVNIYSPEQLKGMSAKEINAAIERDISENAWERQKAAPVRYRGRRKAEGLERALYLCPACSRIGTLRTQGDDLFCECGKRWRYTDFGSFDPPEPFENIADWEDWQRGALLKRNVPEGEALFSDGGFTLTRLEHDHSEQPMGAGTLTQYADRIVCAGKSFRLSEIDNMAMVLSRLLLLSVGGEYWQIRSDGNANLRKYLEIWKHREVHK